MSRIAPRIFMYVLAKDGGFAPNPFFGWCTLACCKPAIRRTARPGDWVVGITSRRAGHRLAYAMRVQEVLTFEDYWFDKRFRAKRPGSGAGLPRLLRCGDNCYRPVGNGEFRQVRGSGHWDRDRDREDERMKKRDLGGRHALVSRIFSYFGDGALPFPRALSSLPFPGRGHRVSFRPAERSALLRYLESLPRGMRGRPPRWWKDDSSWKQGRRACD